MRSRTYLLAAAVLLVTALAGCDGDDDDGGAVGVDATVEEWAVTASPDTAEAGSVEFEVTNDGSIAHEFVVISTDLAPEELPVEGGVVPEDEVDVVGEIEEFEPGGTETATFQLAVGDYVLICNIPAHYDNGMRAAFMVT